MGADRKDKGFWRLAAALLTLILAACASGPGANDPLEASNRALFAFNEKVNANVTLPVAWVYVNYVPEGVRGGIHHVLDNVESPVVFANDLLQGEFSRAGTTLGRFLVNSTIGVGGLADIAARWGLKGHAADFGQTLARYGVASGPFLVLPIVGPTTPRDLFGTVVDLAADPLSYVPADWSLAGHIGAVVGIHTVLPFEKHAGAVFLRRKLAHDSVDPYATMRSVYRQQRADEIGDSGPPILPDTPDFP